MCGYSARWMAEGCVVTVLGGWRRGLGGLQCKVDCGRGGGLPVLGGWRGLEGLQCKVDCGRGGGASSARWMAGVG